MRHAHPLKQALKRGALIAAANWQVTLIQAVADSVFKLLLAVPVVGGMLLVALVLGTEPDSLLSLEWRDMAATVLNALLAHPVVLTAFLLAVAVVGIGGSLFVFVVKAGSVGVLVHSDREAGAIEDAPLHLEPLARTGRFSVERFFSSCERLFPRYARLGFTLIAVYLVSAGVYVVLLRTARATVDSWALTALITAGLIVWITAVNLLYLLMQVIVAADDCGVRAAGSRLAVFVRRERRAIGAVFIVVLTLFVGAMGASLVAATALSLIAFVPLVGLAVLPLQLIAWVLRALLLQYLGLASVGAYMRLYRTHAAASVAGESWERGDLIASPGMPPRGTT